MLPVGINHLSCLIVSDTVAERFRRGISTVTFLNIISGQSIASNDADVYSCGGFYGSQPPLSFSESAQVIVRGKPC